jgi:hypothetical protein
MTVGCCVMIGGGHRSHPQIRKPSHAGVNSCVFPLYRNEETTDLRKRSLDAFLFFSKCIGSRQHEEAMKPYATSCDSLDRKKPNTAVPGVAGERAEWPWLCVNRFAWPIIILPRETSTMLCRSSQQPEMLLFLCRHRLGACDLSDRLQKLARLVPSTELEFGQDFPAAVS